jgi:hypothetical protein
MTGKMAEGVGNTRLGLLSDVEKGSPLGYYFAVLIIVFVSAMYALINYTGFVPGGDILVTVVCDSLLILGSFMFFVTSLVGYIKSKNLRIRSGILAFTVSSFSYFMAGCFWTWYNMAMQVAIPYPSIADVFYVIGSLALIFAIYYMTKTLNVNLGLKVEMNVLIVFLAIVATAAIIVAYASFTNLFRDGIGLGAVISIAYPVLDIICLAMVGNLILISFGRSVFEAQVVLAIGACIMCMSHIYFSIITAMALSSYGTLFITLSAISYMLYAMGVSRYVDLTKFDILVDRLAKLNKRM